MSGESNPDFSDRHQLFFGKRELLGIVLPVMKAARSMIHVKTA